MAIDAIVEAELERALAEPDPLRGIAALVARCAAAFVLDPDGVTRTKVLGSERMSRKLARGAARRRRAAARRAVDVPAPDALTAAGRTAPRRVRHRRRRRAAPSTSPRTAATPASTTSTSTTRTTLKTGAPGVPAPPRGGHPCRQPFFHAPRVVRREVALGSSAPRITPHGKTEQGGRTVPTLQTGPGADAIRAARRRPRTAPRRTQVKPATSEPPRAGFAARDVAGSLEPESGRNVRSQSRHRVGSRCSVGKRAAVRHRVSSRVPAQPTSRSL